MKVSEALAELREVELLLAAVNREAEDIHTAVDEFKGRVVDALWCEHADVLQAARERCSIDFLCGIRLLRVHKEGGFWRLHHFVPLLVD